ncbi:S8 family peptidase [Crassaminicella profunda]|uniref:S8 family peptidase n=1 Tax=Crassaminicella profunda TaxID=1286698 RepID=UPI001CA7908D|nr:S8 family peptidase [Crassaminicella profunda]QZY55144.1 S8 family peptidase [Crassaminicella profunda]
MKMNVRKVRSQFVHPVVVARMSAGTKEKIQTIVYSQGNCDHIRDLILDAGGKIKYDIPLINAVVAEIPAKEIDHVAAHHMIQFINHDAKVFKCMNNASVAVAGHLVHDVGYTGKGVGIAVLDTGVYPHDDLVKPTNRIIAFKDIVNNKSYPYDDDGHGTHVAGIAAGSGYANKKYMGIAPEANIIGVKVLDETGSGSTSDILAGLQWVIDNKDKYNIKIVNMSLGAPAEKSYREDPLAKGAAEAARQGLTVITAAGNSGPNPRTITSPGISPSVITVGAVDDNRTTSYEDDFIANFSSRGPTTGGVSKPNIVAPGVDIMSLSNKGHSSYVSHSGTSMATPMVSGTAALLYQKEPNISPAEVQSKLTGTAINIGDSIYAEGAGILNIGGALDLDKEELKEPNQHKNPYPDHHNDYPNNHQNNGREFHPRRRSGGGFNLGFLSNLLDPSLLPLLLLLL